MKIKKFDITNENLTQEMFCLFCYLNTYIDRINSIFMRKKDK